MTNANRTNVRAKVLEREEDCPLSLNGRKISKVWLPQSVILNWQAVYYIWHALHIESPTLSRFHRLYLCEYVLFCVQSERPMKNAAVEKYLARNYSIPLC